MIPRKGKLPPRIASPDDLEGDILGDVLVAITSLPETLAYRSNSGLFRSMDGKRVVRSNVPGIGDVSGCRKGRAFCIETKTLTGPQRKTQQNFERQFTKAGGVYLLARSADAARAALLEAIP